ncbi:Chaperone protein focC precursor [Buttiauxella agrestis]|uniref:Chaperone protein focC n=1 Tax=Buttiauxella agrestis TaxID=82977 RepID=A0A381KQP4_9ENTR|nr:molecular chaperone [Buttiauxella agrestis]SUY92931.1 Chaperone protein focC precursor [Buttiauxella agrestis]
MKKTLILLPWILITTQAQAGVVVGGTRFVFPEHQNTLSLEVKNTGSLPFLIKTQITADSGAVPFIATPPLFAVEAGHENAVRIIRTDGTLPDDRESLFYISIAAIPSGKPQPHSLQIALRSRFKLFYRPDALQANARTAYQQIAWHQNENGLVINNSTPYYITLSQLRINQRDIPIVEMLAPFGQEQFNVCARGEVCQLQWQTLDDTANLTPLQQAHFPSH